MTSLLQTATQKAFLSFVAEFGGQYDVRNEAEPRLRFRHPVIGEADVMRYLHPESVCCHWSFAWWVNDFETGRRRLMGARRSSSGNPDDTDSELTLLMCEITSFEPCLLIDVGFDFGWRQNAPKLRFLEGAYIQALCYPPVNFARLLEKIGEPYPVAGTDWEILSGLQVPVQSSDLLR